MSDPLERLRDTFAADEIERLREQRRWIRVSERLPEQLVDVLVGYNTREGGMAVDKGWFTTELNWGSQWFVGDEDVDATHWMPLPEPPEAT